MRQISRLRQRLASRLPSSAKGEAEAIVKPSGATGVDLCQATDLSPAFASGGTDSDLDEGGEALVPHSLFREGKLNSAAPPNATLGALIVDDGSVLGLRDSEIVTHFDSLGDNCEFGFIQRKLGFEPLSLLRWAGIQLPHLLRAFMDDFNTGPDLLTSLDVEGSRREYMLKIMPLGWRGHTFTYEGDEPADKVLEEQTVKFRYLASKLIEDLEQGEKIFVFRRNEPIVDDSIYALHDAINWYGPNTLLWVVEAEGDNEPGSVRWLRPGLMQGYVSRLSVRHNPTLVNQPTWAQICRAAYDLWGHRKQPLVESWAGSRLLQHVKFGTEGNGALFCTAGWGRQEYGFVWGNADVSTLTLPRPDSCDAYAMKLSLKPFRPDGILRQRLSVLVNGTSVKTFSAVPDGIVICHIPAELVAGRETLEVTFVCPGGLSPKDARVGNDTRKLTIEFREMRFYGLSLSKKLPEAEIAS